MPRHRRRRFQRMRKRLREQTDDHTWVLRKTSYRKHSKINLPALHGEPAFSLNFKMQLILCESLDMDQEGRPAAFKKAKRFRKCSVCGMELVGNSKPQMSCKMTLAEKVMNS